MTMRESVQSALGARPLTEQDQATAELALTYARLLDDAAPAARYVEALRWLDRIEVDDDADERHLTKIRTALAEHSVASDLGPKLLAALEALGLSPRARAATVRGGKPDDQPAKSPLDELRERRRTRAGRAAAVDPTP